MIKIQKLTFLLNYDDLEGVPYTISTVSTYSFLPYKLGTHLSLCGYIRNEFIDIISKWGKKKNPKKIFLGSLKYVI